MKKIKLWICLQLIFTSSGRLFSSDIMTSYLSDDHSCLSDDHSCFSTGYDSQMTFYELGCSTDLLRKIHVPVGREKSSSDNFDLELSNISAESQQRRIESFFDYLGLGKIYTLDQNFISELKSKTNIDEIYQFLTKKALNMVGQEKLNLALTGQLAIYQRALVAAYIKNFTNLVDEFYQNYPDVESEVDHLIFHSDNSFRSSPDIEAKTLRYKLAKILKD